ncbi:MAG: relaxase/mobilization nuclease domain-containing protein, partial [Methylocella sp.]
VGWTQTINLATADPEKAWKIMAHTAMMQGELKAQAGVKASGRKLTEPVFAYSLSYHPDDRPTRARQEKDARDSLKVLGLEENQAILVSHTDTKHDHVHVIVNRVHPETGKAASVGRSMLKLSQWAQQCEQEQGRVVCPQRVENNARRKHGEFVRSPRIPRPTHELNRAIANVDGKLGVEYTQTIQRQLDAQMNEIKRQMQTAHARQWEALKASYDTVKTRRMDYTKKLKEAKAVQIKGDAANKARWRDLFTRQRQGRKQFEAAERGTISKIMNMVFVYQTMRRHDPNADALTIFYTLVSSSQRRAVFEADQQRQQKELARQIKRETAAAFDTIDRDEARDMNGDREAWLKQCAALKKIQAAQRVELKAKWQVRNDERTQALGPIKERAKKYRQARHFRRGRSIKDDDLFRRPPQKPDPGQGGGPKMG